MGFFSKQALDVLEFYVQVYHDHWQKIRIWVGQALSVWVLWKGEKYMPRSRQVVKKLMEGGRTLRNALIGSLSPVSRSISINLHAITYRFPLLYFARFPFLVLARPATDHSAHTHYYPFSVPLPRCHLPIVQSG